MTATDKGEQFRSALQNLLSANTICKDIGKSNSNLPICVDEEKEKNILYINLATDHSGML